MSRVILDISPSLDGYVAGRDITLSAPFGDAGERLHRWMGFDAAAQDDADRAAFARVFASAGAAVIGRRMFDVGIDHWGEDGAFRRPCVVVTHRAGAALVRGATTFHFETAGVAAAIARAKALAGDGDVVICGGGEIARQSVALGLVDELRLHVVPVLLGHGARLFGDGPMTEWALVEAAAGRHALHQTYRRARSEK